VDACQGLVSRRFCLKRETHTMSARLQDKVVMVTGAAGGLGQAAAAALANEGARLALTDVDSARLEGTVALVRAAGAEVVSLVGDVTAPETHARLVAQALQAFGALHGLCNVAGILGPGSLAEATRERFDRVMQVNCFAQLLAIQAAAAPLRESGCGAIVNVASVGALVALPMMSLYCASKAAVLGLTRAVAAELAPHVRCNAVCPGGIDTPMAHGLLAQVSDEHRGALLEKLTGRQMLKRFARPDEIAQTLVFLVSEESSFLTGSVLAADAGHSAS